MTMRRLTIIGLIVAGLGAASLAAERAFYGDVGADGVLRESLFLPLGAGLIGLGILALVAAIIVANRNR